MPRSKKYPCKKRIAEIKERKLCLKNSKKRMPGFAASATEERSKKDGRIQENHSERV